MFKLLLDLEKDFFKRDKITDKRWLNNTLHDKFKEIGQSGTIFYKSDTIKALTSLNSDRKIDIYNFETEIIGDKCALVHYITKNINKQLIYRTSVRINENNWKLIFHQASVLNTVITLEKY